jgi:hypothetical protein
MSDIKDVDPANPSATLLLDEATGISIDAQIAIDTVAQSYAAEKEIAELKAQRDELPISYYADKPGVLGDALRVIAKANGE